MARACHLAESGYVGSVSKGRRSPLLFKPSSPAPLPVNSATSTGIYYPGRRGLALSRHSEAATSTPTATASQEAGRLQLAASAGTLGTPTAVPAPCPEFCQSKGWDRGGSSSSQREQVHCHPRPLFLDLAARPWAVESNEASDHFSAGTKSLQNRQTDRHSLYCFWGSRALNMQD